MTLRNLHPRGRRARRWKTGCRASSRRVTQWSLRGRLRKADTRRRAHRAARSSRRDRAAKDRSFARPFAVEGSLGCCCSGVIVTVIQGRNGRVSKARARRSPLVEARQIPTVWRPSAERHNFTTCPAAASSAILRAPRRAGLRPPRSVCAGEPRFLSGRGIRSSPTYSHNGDPRAWGDRPDGSDALASAERERHLTGLLDAPLTTGLNDVPSKAVPQLEVQDQATNSLSNVFPRRSSTGGERSPPRATSRRRLRPRSVADAYRCSCDPRSAVGSDQRGSYLHTPSAVHHLTSSREASVHRREPAGLATNAGKSVTGSLPVTGPCCR